MYETKPHRVRIVRIAAKDLRVIHYTVTPIIERVAHPKALTVLYRRHSKDFRLSFELCFEIGTDEFGEL